ITWTRPVDDRAAAVGHLHSRLAGPGRGAEDADEDDRSDHASRDRHVEPPTRTGSPPPRGADVTPGHAFRQSRPRTAVARLRTRRRFRILGATWIPSI